MKIDPIINMSEEGILSTLPSPLFIIGPAHSGKSELAAHCANRDSDCLVMGTSTVTEESFVKRVKELQKFRPTNWKTVENCEKLPTALAEAATTYPQIIIDSLNQWMSTQLVKATTNYSLDQVESIMSQEFEDLRQAILAMETSNRRLVLVSGEGGAGTTPSRAPERLYRTLLGRLNQSIATAASSVVAVHAGIPLRIK